MAIKLAVTKAVYGQEIVINNAYHRIERVEGNKDNVTIHLAIYTENQEQFVEVNFYQFKPSNDEDASRWDKQGYEYLKNLDEFIDAVDC